MKATGDQRRTVPLARDVRHEEVNSVKEYLSLKEAAERLGVEYKTVWRLVNQGKLPAGKVMGVWRISESDLDAFFKQQKVLATDQCAGCGKPILSTLSFGGRCEVCEAPLCLSCWRIEGRRVCGLHQPEEAVQEEAEFVRCARCGQAISSVEMTGGRCEALGCEALLCVNCWRKPDGHLCSQHVTTAGEKLEKARAQLVRGEIDRLVTGVEAKTRESRYIARFDQKVRQVASLREPRSGEVLRTADWDRCQVTGDDTARLLEILGVGYLDKAFLGRVPVNLRSCYEVPSREERGPRLVIEAIVFSHLEAHAHDGFDTAPATLANLLPLVEDRAARAENMNVTYVLGIAATSGWDGEAAGYIRADVQGRSFSHRLLLPYLIDLHLNEVIYNTLDERTAALADFFSPRLFGEVVQLVVDYVQQTVLTSGRTSVTARQVTQALSIRPEAVREAFRQLSSDGEFTVEEISGLGLVIARH